MTEPAVLVVGTFDSKPEEHLFLKKAIEKRGLPVLTINVGAKEPPGFEPDFNLRPESGLDRDRAVQTVIDRGRELAARLYKQGRAAGMISAGGGTGTHIGASIMKVLPLGAPKVMVSTVAARDMGPVVGTRDITMMHTVSDLLGVNSVSGLILDAAAGAVCGMVRSGYEAAAGKKVIGLTMFGFITRAAEMVRAHLEEMGHEVVAFHANGAGGLAMEELAAEGRFDGILDLATHELADSLYAGGYCRLIGPGRLAPLDTPRLVVPGGLDCAVLEFTRETAPPDLADRRIFYYDFRSAVSLDADETAKLARRLIEGINAMPGEVRVLAPMGGWSEASSAQGPLYSPKLGRELMTALRAGLDGVEITETEHHILDPDFALLAARTMDSMLR